MGNPKQPDPSMSYRISSANRNKELNAPLDRFKTNGVSFLTLDGSKQRPILAEAAKKSTTAALSNDERNQRWIFRSVSGANGDQRYYIHCLNAGNSSCLERQGDDTVRLRQVVPQAKNLDQIWDVRMTGQGNEKWEVVKFPSGNVKLDVKKGGTQIIAVPVGDQKNPGENTFWSTHDERATKKDGF